MNKDNDLRAKLQARHQQNVPKGKRPAAIAAGTAVAPVKRQKLDQIHQRKPLSQPTSTHTQGTSSTATQNQQTIHLPNLFPAKKIVKQTKPLANLPTDATRKEYLSEKPQQSSKNDQIQMQIQKELKLLNESPIQSEVPPAEFNQEYFSNLSLPKAIEMLQTFGHNPLNYSKMIEFMVEKKYQIEKDTLMKIMPFLRSYQLIGATCVEKFLSYYRAQLCELDQSFKIKSEQSEENIILC